MRIKEKVVIDGKVVAYVSDDISIGALTEEKLHEYLKNNSCVNAVELDGKIFLIGKVDEVGAVTCNTVVGSEPENKEVKTEEKQTKKEDRMPTAVKFSLLKDKDEDKKEYYKATIKQNVYDKRYYKNYDKGELLVGKPKVGEPYFDKDNKFHLNDFQPNYSKEQMLFGVNIIEQYCRKVRDCRDRIKDTESQLLNLEESELSPENARVKKHNINKRIKLIAEYIATVLYPLANTKVVDYIAYTRALTKYGCADVMKVVDYEKMEKEFGIIGTKDPDNYKKLTKIIRHEIGEAPMLNFEANIVKEYVKLGDPFTTIIRQYRNHKKDVHSQSIKDTRYVEFDVLRRNEDIGFDEYDSVRSDLERNDFKGMHYTKFDERLDKSRKIAYLGNSIYAKRIRLAIINKAIKDVNNHALNYDISGMIKCFDDNIVTEQLFVYGEPAVCKNAADKGIEVFDNDVIVLNEIFNMLGIDVIELSEYYTELREHCENELKYIVSVAKKLGIRDLRKFNMDIDIFKCKWLDTVMKNLDNTNSNSRSIVFAKNVTVTDGLIIRFPID